MQLSNKTYNAIKWAITIGLPAVGAFYFALAHIWNFSNSEGVNGTINAAIAFFGLLIGYSGRRYAQRGGDTDGDLYVNHDEDGKRYLSLGVKNDSYVAMPTKDVVTLRVVDKTASVE